MKEGQFWKAALFSRAPYLKLDREKVRPIELGAAAGNVIVSSRRVPLRVRDFVGIVAASDVGRGRRAAIREAVLNLDSIEKAAVLDYYKVFFGESPDLIEDDPLKK